MKLTNIVFTMFIVITSCTKHAGDAEEPTPAAVLIITQPITNQVINKTDSVRVAGSAIASAVMHGYDVYLTKQSDTTKLQILSVHDHNDTLLINRSFAPMSAGNYEAHILLKLDHDGNTLHKSVFFKTQ